jgi:hypothetical protein
MELNRLMERAIPQLTIYAYLLDAFTRFLGNFKWTLDAFS